MARKTKRPNKPRKPSRPTVIDLQAEEIDLATGDTVKPAQDAAAGGPAHGASTDQAKAAPGTKGPTGDDAAAKGRGQNPSAGEPGAGEQDRAGKGLLIAASLAALIAAAAAGAWVYSTSGPSGVASGQVARLQEQLDNLHRDANDRADRIARFEADLQTARTELLGHLKAQQDSTTDRLTAMGKGIEDLRTAMSEASSAGEGGSAAQAGTALKVDELTASVDSLKQQIALLEQTVASMQAGTGEAVIDALKQRVDALGDGLAAVRQEQEARARQTVSALGQSFAKLSSAVAEGNPFAAELDSVVKVVPTMPGIAELRKFADTGVASSQMLASGLDRIAAEHLESQARKADENAQQDGILAAIGAKLATVVKIRKIGETDWPGTLGMAAEQIRAGDLKNAVAALAGKTGTPPAGLGAWLDTARDKIAADAAMDTLSQAVLRHLAATGTSG